MIEMKATILLPWILYFSLNVFSAHASTARKAIMCYACRSCFTVVPHQMTPTCISGYRSCFIDVRLYYNTTEVQIRRGCNEIERPVGIVYTRRYPVLYSRGEYRQRYLTCAYEFCNEAEFTEDSFPTLFSGDSDFQTNLALILASLSVPGFYAFWVTKFK